MSRRRRMNRSLAKNHARNEGTVDTQNVGATPTSAGPTAPRAPKQLHLELTGMEREFEPGAAIPIEKAAYTALDAIEDTSAAEIDAHDDGDVSDDVETDEAAN